MPKYNLSIVQKICFAGIFIPLVAIFQKVFAINYISIIPFVRISFGGPALIIFASIILGPWFGALVGILSDLIGFFIFDPKMFGSLPFFQITAIYGLLGFSSYFVFKWINKIKNVKVMSIIEVSTFLAFLIAVTLFVNLSDSITLYGVEYEFTTLHRILIPVILFILLLLLSLFVFLINIHFKNKDIKISVFNVSFSCFILEVVVMLIFGTIMKTWAFSSTTFLAIFLSQLAVLFFNIPLNTILISYLMTITRRVLLVKEYA